MAQTFQNFEIIVIDDASTDDTFNAVDRIRDSRIRYIRHEKNKGDAASRNTGILNSTGEYVAFLDDDDEWMPQKLALQVDLLTATPDNVGGVFSGTISVDGSTGEILGRSIPRHNVDSVLQILAGNMISTSSLVLRRSCLERVDLFDEQIPYNSDYDMWIRVAKKFRLLCIEEALVKYRVHQKKLSVDYRKMTEGWEIIINKYNDFFSLQPKGYSQVHRALGVLYGLSGDSEKARRLLRTAITLYPAEPRHYFDLLLIWLGTNRLRTLKRMQWKVATRIKKHFRAAL